MSRRRRHVGPSGFVVVDKDPGWTSHDVVAKARGVFSTRKVGHSGTLDPGATGVLVLGVGHATRLLRFVTDLEKTYVAEAVLGVETDTLDADGTVTKTHDMAGVDIDDVARVATDFVGDIEQIPPMVSAIKVDGRRLHELAREGIEIERAPRPVTVYQLDVEAVRDEPLAFRFTTRCSSGTYIRTLAADIGAALGGGAHLRHLRRTAIGSHTEAAARPLESAPLVPIAQGLADLDRVDIDEATVGLVRHGQRIVDGEFTGSGPWLLVGPGDEAIAVHERVDDGRIKPGVVIPVDSPAPAD